MTISRDNTWRTKARAIITGPIVSAKHLGELPTTGDEFVAFKRRVSQLYPWGERKHHPYKAWCMEMSIAFDRLYAEIFANTGVHSAYRVRCPACDAGAGVPCRSMGAIQDDLMIAKVAKLEDVTRRQAMLITKLVREQGPVVDAAKAWRAAYKSEHNLDGARAVRAANQALADAVDKKRTGASPAMGAR